MEADTVNGSAPGLEDSRQRLRQELLPAREVPGEFPRSTVMRVLFDPRTQRALLLALSAAAMLVTRGRRTRRMRRGGLADTLQQLAHDLGRRH